MAEGIRVDIPVDRTVTQLTQVLRNLGFRIERFFDLRSAMTLISTFPCQHHKLSQCDCQYIVLFAYTQSDKIINVTVHGYDEISWIAVDDGAYSLIANDKSYRSIILAILSLNPLD